MNIGKLKKLIADLPDDLPVYIHDPSKVYAGSVEDDMFHVNTAKVQPQGQINDRYFEIQRGAGFGW